MTARSEERAARAIAAEKLMTFEEAARQYFAGHEQQWTNAHYRKKFLSSLEMYAFPQIGNLPVAAIDTPLVLNTTSH
jgi:hypothetical protein